MCPDGALSLLKQKLTKKLSRFDLFWKASKLFIEFDLFDQHKYGNKDPGESQNRPKRVFICVYYDFN